MSWCVEYSYEAQDDLASLDNSQRIQVIKSIKKVSGNPLPAAERGYGKPLGNRQSSHLAGFLKIKLENWGFGLFTGLLEIIML